MNRTQPRVALLATGGTIDSLGNDRTDLAWYLDTGKRLDTGVIVSRVPELSTVAEIEQIPYRRLNSYALTGSDWIELAALVRRVLDTGPAGLVITHGTNTLEETAYFLNLTVGSTVPVVMTGAMRPANALSSDGDINLFRAVQVAAAPQARGHGVLVVMNEGIYSARDVTKSDTYHVDTFQARGAGPLGSCDADGDVVFYHRQLRRHTVRSRFATHLPSNLPTVEVIVSYAGAGAELIEAVAARKVAGIVVAATGPGVPTPPQTDALIEAAHTGITVCLCGRGSSGRVRRGSVTAARGWVTGDNLPPWKARVLLSLALTQTTDPERIQRLFDSH